jgi:hypothetical protein
MLGGIFLFYVRPGDEGRPDETLSFQHPLWMWEVALVQWSTKAQAKKWECTL